MQKLAVGKLTPYMKAEKSYALPSYDRDVKRITIDKQTPLFLIEKLQSENNYDFELVIKKPKKSLLKKLVDWLTNNT